MIKIAKIGVFAALMSAVVMTTGCASTSQSVGYEFEVVQTAANSDFPLAVRVMDATTGQPVTNAEVFVVHTLAGSPKSIPQTVWHRTQLKNDGRGVYLYPGDIPPGQAVRLAARVPGAPGEVTAIVEPRRG